MCGIFGYFDRHRRPLPAELIAEMSRTIAHRGPDDDGLLHDAERGAAIGNRRLAIIDPEHGHQPFVSDDGDIALVQNGAIFNYKELAEELRRVGVHCRTDCDTEVLLRLYETHGLSFLSKLNGMFALAIYDRREDCIFLARDRVGEKPLHYSYDGDRLLFGSEIKAILAASPNVAPSSSAIYQYLRFNYVPPPLTMFEGIEHVMPGQWMRFDRRGVTSGTWWDLSAVPQEELAEDVWSARLMELLDDAVRLRLRSDVSFGAFLSGGVDSSTVVGLMSRHLPTPVKTFSIGFDDPQYDESAFAQSTADRFGTEHCLEIVDPDMFDLWPMTTYHCDQPHGDVSFLPTYRVAELSSRSVKMVLTGDGADELFAGYDKYPKFFSSPGRPVGADYFESISLYDDQAIGRLLSAGFRRSVEPIDSFENIVAPLLGRVEHMDPVNKALYLDTMLLLPGNNLVKPDRMGMAASIENRAPFLDYRVVELAFSMPGALKLGGAETKYILKKAVAPLIGREHAYRSKQMFTVPVGTWLRTHLYDHAHSLLLAGQAVGRGMFEMQEIESMMVAHRAGSANFTRELRALMALEIWFQTFFPE